MKQITSIKAMCRMLCCCRKFNELKFLRRSNHQNMAARLNFSLTPGHCYPPLYSELQHIVGIEGCLGSMHRTTCACGLGIFACRFYNSVSTKFFFKKVMTAKNVHLLS